jgi:outer membrane protein insertion porin family
LYQMGETQRRLYDLGVFAEVDMAVQNPDGNEQHKYVLFDMQEASRYSVSGGVGATLARIGGGNAQADLTNPGGSTGVSPRVELDVSRINFLGLGHTVSLRSRYSTLEKRGVFDYLAPRIFNHQNLDLSFDALYDDAHDVRTFSAKRAEVSMQLTDRLTKALTSFFRYSYRRVNVGTLKIDPLLIPRLSQADHIGMFSANLVEDRRDDPTDAHKGRYNTLDVGYATALFGSRTSFLRVLGRNATYYRVTRKLLLARELSLGIAPAFGNTVTSPIDDDPIPLPERFFGGGGETMRGFGENQAGPRDLKTGFPLGGSALLFNKTELRFPLIGDNIGGVAFHDMGNIYSSPGAISFRVHQKDLTDFNYMVHAAGFGIRYKTPIGPVRLDLAYSINPPRFNGFKGTFNDLLICTSANNCTTAQQRISHFQFFFSIGQTF